jgi:hypothetical protein
MDLSSRKLAVIELILATNDEHILATIQKLLFDISSIEFSKSTKNEFIANIEESMTDYYAGKYKSAKDLLKHHYD